MIKEVHQSSNINVKSTRQTILCKGGKLGLLASVLGSFLFLCFYVSVLWISATLSGVEFVSENFLNDRQGYWFLLLIVYWTLGFLLTFLISVIPSILAGLGNALLLSIFTQSVPLTSFRGVIIGMIVGGIFSIIPISIGLMLLTRFVFDAPSLKEQSQVIMEIVISGILTALISGAWHGWRMTRYLDSSNQ